jgi:hypothetical protein
VKNEEEELENELNFLVNDCGFTVDEILQSIEKLKLKYQLKDVRTSDKESSVQDEKENLNG